MQGLTSLLILQGNYGFKRFGKDVHHTSMDKTWKKKFSPEELEVCVCVCARTCCVVHWLHDVLQAFEGSECEWPIFFLYAFITGKSFPMCHLTLCYSFFCWQNVSVATTQLQNSTGISLSLF